MIQAFLPLILWSIVGTDGLQLDASDSADLDRVGPEIHGVFPDGIVDDVFGAGEFQDHHPFLFLITIFGKCLPKALHSRGDRSGMFFRQECLVITTSQKKDSSH